jgi:hypothetical protein
VALDLVAEVALLEEHWRIVTADDRIAEAGLQPVPAGRQRAGDVADVLVVHTEHRTEAGGLHALTRALRSILPQPVPVDALLPVESRDSEISSHVCPLFERIVEGTQEKYMEVASESRAHVASRMDSVDWRG